MSFQAEKRREELTTSKQSSTPFHFHNQPSPGFPNIHRNTPSTRRPILSEDQVEMCASLLISISKSANDSSKRSTYVNDQIMKCFECGVPESGQLVVDWWCCLRGFENGIQHAHDRLGPLSKVSRQLRSSVDESKFETYLRTLAGIRELFPYNTLIQVGNEL